MKFEQTPRSTSHTFNLIFVLEKQKANKDAEAFAFVQ